MYNLHVHQPRQVMHVRRTLACCMSAEPSRGEEYEYTLFMFIHASMFMFMYIIYIIMYIYMYINLDGYAYERNPGL